MLCTAGLGCTRILVFSFLLSNKEGVAIVQTFLPYESFEESARVLDRQRLGKQRVEGYQILKALVLGTGWIHHPATKQWAGHEFWLVDYILVMIDEWTRRGYKDSVRDKIDALLLEYPLPLCSRPDWLGYEPYHASHRANLLRKDQFYYGQFGWTEDSTTPYYWPSHNN